MTNKTKYYPTQLTRQRGEIISGTSAQIKKLPLNYSTKAKRYTWGWWNQARPEIYTRHSRLVDFCQLNGITWFYSDSASAEYWHINPHTAKEQK